MCKFSVGLVQDLPNHLVTWKTTQVFHFQDTRCLSTAIRSTMPVLDRWVHEVVVWSFNFQAYLSKFFLAVAIPSCHLLCVSAITLKTNWSKRKLASAPSPSSATVVLAVGTLLLFCPGCEHWRWVKADIFCRSNKASDRRYRRAQDAVQKIAAESIQVYVCDGHVHKCEARSKSKERQQHHLMSVWHVMLGHILDHAKFVHQLLEANMIAIHISRNWGWTSVIRTNFWTFQPSVVRFMSQCLGRLHQQRSCCHLCPSLWPGQAQLRSRPHSGSASSSSHVASNGFWMMFTETVTLHG